MLLIYMGKNKRSCPIGCSVSKGVLTFEGLKKKYIVNGYTAYLNKQPITQ